MEKISIFILALNEVDGIKNWLPQMKKEWADEYFVLDGNSTDGTIEAAKKLGFKVISQKEKGMGNGIRDAFEAAQGDYVAYCSPDGNDEAKDIPRLIHAIKENDYDMVHITRFGHGGKSQEAGFIDRFGNKMFAFLVNCFFGGKLTDVFNGFRIIKKKVFFDLKTDVTNMTMELQMNIRCLKKGYKIYEIGGNEPDRIGKEITKKPHTLIVGAQVSYQIFKEFIFW